MPPILREAIRESMRYYLRSSPSHVETICAVIETREEWEACCDWIQKIQDRTVFRGCFKEEHDHYYDVQGSRFGVKWSVGLVWREAEI